jgi:uncharacterized protein YjbI with pentapeptide repeats
MPVGQPRQPGGRWRFERPVANAHRAQRGAGHPQAVIAHTRPDWGQRLASLVSVATVAVAVAALLFTNEASGEQARLTQQGHITDRFTSAVDQLGSDQIDVRLGGIYALERIMRDSPPDEPAVVAVLAAYVRDHAARLAAPQPPRPPARSPVATQLGSDVQAALTVIGRRPGPNTPDGREVVELTYLDLTHVELVDANLAQANLTGANLSYAQAPGGDLTGAALDEANLAAADLANGTLTGADLDGADLTGATLTGANLAHSSAVDGNLANASLAFANLSRARLTHATLPNADLSNARLVGASLLEANLTGANLTHTQLIGANLTSANLATANLPGANLSGADLTGANLAGANLSGATLTGAKLAGARVDGNTRLPAGTTIPTQAVVAP